MPQLKSSYQIKKEFVATLQQGWYCSYCWTPEKLCIEHLIPVVKGGTEDLRNLVLACQRCNSRKLHYNFEQLNKNGNHYIAVRVRDILAERKHWGHDIIEERLAMIDKYVPEPSEAKPEYRALLSDYQTSLSRKIHEAIVARGISRHQVRRHLGLSGWTVDRWCTGEAQPKAHNLKRLCEYLGKDIQDFLPSVKKHSHYDKMDEPSRALVDKVWELGLALGTVGLSTHETTDSCYVYLAHKSLFMSTLGEENLHLLEAIRGENYRKGYRQKDNKLFKMTAVARYFHFHRLQKKLFLYEVAAACGKSPSTLSKHLRKSVSEAIYLDTIEQLERIFEVPFIESDWSD